MIDQINQYEWKKNAARIVSNALSIGEYSCEVGSDAEACEIINLCDDIFTKCSVQDMGRGVKRVIVTRIN